MDLPRVTAIKALGLNSQNKIDKNYSNLILQIKLLKIPKTFSDIIEFQVLTNLEKALVFKYHFAMLTVSFLINQITL